MANKHCGGCKYLVPALPEVVCFHIKNLIDTPAYLEEQHNIVIPGLQKSLNWLGKQVQQGKPCPLREDD